MNRQDGASCFVGRRFTLAAIAGVAELVDAITGICKTYPLIGIAVIRKVAKKIRKAQKCSNEVATKMVRAI